MAFSSTNHQAVTCFIALHSSITVSSSDGFRRHHHEQHMTSKQDMGTLSHEAAFVHHIPSHYTPYHCSCLCVRRPEPTRRASSSDCFFLFSAFSSAQLHHITTHPPAHARLHAPSTAARTRYSALERLPDSLPVRLVCLVPYRCSSSKQQTGANQVRVPFISILRLQLLSYAQTRSP